MCRLSGLAARQLCVTSFWVWEELPNSATPSLSCDHTRNQEWGGKHEAARWSICAITPSAVNLPHSSS